MSHNLWQKCFLSECWNQETMIFVKEKKESQNIATATVTKPWFYSPHQILHQFIQCSKKQLSINPMPDNSAENCEYDEWSPYSECSVTCGQGKKFSQRFLKKYSVRFQIHSKFKLESYWLSRQQFETDSEHFANHSKFEKLIVFNLNVNQAMKIFVFIILHKSAVD